MLYTVVTASRSSGIAQGLTYESKEDIPLGSHVKVPLRKTVVDGIVIGINRQKAQSDYDVKAVQGVLGDAPYLTTAQLRTLSWMSEYYCCSLRQALQVWLPAPPWNSLLPKETKAYFLANPEAKVRGKKQQSIIEYLWGGKATTLEQLRSETGASTTTINSLVEKAVLKVEVVEKPTPKKADTQSLTFPSLTAGQESVYKDMSKDAKPSLLFGVTSSGKTEIYASMIVDCVKAGKQAILLVPEILLTEHCIHRFQKLLGEEHVEVLHSRLTPAQKRNAWKRIHAGEASLVIGSRSALFAPLKNIGLILLDEEHEWTYKNEQTPRYHAREVAEKLCAFSNAKLVLGTATPSLESWAKAKSGKYHIVRLSERYQNKPFPKVRVIDLATVQFGSLYPFSPPLLQEIDTRLQSNEQSILFLNRRGVASALLCLDCRRRVVSPDSLLPFTVHHTMEGEEYLVDHTTGLRAGIPDVCPHCNSAKLQAVGAGTQKLEDILRRQFPSARILRADKDTLKKPEKMQSLLSDMRENRADILLGTQSVVKGLDLPHVTLAAVLLADVGLSLPHFRAGERIFQILTQLTGRSGRARPGEVIIQTFRPDAPEVKFASEHRTEEYLEEELRLRAHAKYPPFTKMIRLVFRNDNPEERAKTIQSQLSEVCGSQQTDASISCAPAFFGGGKVWHVFIRGSNPRKILKNIDLQNAIVDVDPIECV